MKKTKFNWKCIHCGKRNIDVVAFQFDIPNYYDVEWECEKCGKSTEISWSLNIDYPKKKPPQAERNKP